MIKTNLHFYFDNWEVDWHRELAIKSGFSTAIFTIETNMDFDLKLKDQMFPIKYIENLNLFEFSKIITFVRNKITQEVFDNVCTVINDSIFHVYSIEYNLNADKSISRDIWFCLYGNNK